MYQVCIDPGHGGTDSGAVNGTRYEKNDVLKMALAVGEILSANQVAVTYTRTTDRYDSPTEKAAIANQSNAGLTVSIHRNAAAATAKGVENLIYSGTAKTAAMADQLCKRYAELGFVNRGVKERPNLAMLRQTRMPSILLELGFISNAEDNRLYDQKFNEIARITAEEILSFFGVTIQEQKKSSWQSNGGRWRYVHADSSYMKNGWEIINRHWYYFDENGYMMTGLVKIKDQLYYLNEEKNQNEGICMKTNESGAFQIWTL